MHLTNFAEYLIIARAEHVMLSKVSIKRLNYLLNIIHFVFHINVKIRNTLNKHITKSRRNLKMSIKGIVYPQDTLSSK